MHVSIDYAVEEPALGAAVGSLLAMAATAHAVSRATHHHR